MRLVTILKVIILLCIHSIVYSQTTEEQEMLNLVNQLRQDKNPKLLRLNTSLNLAAKNHSKDMAKNNYFSHTGLNGSSFSERAKEVGYKGEPRAENIVAGNSDVNATFNQWVNSSGHLNNMLNVSANEMGIGRAYDSNSTYKYYWTQVFGKGDETLSNNDFTNVKPIKIYPNPAKDNITILIKNSNDTELDLKLVSITGQIVYKKSKTLKNNSLSLNINNLTPGVYFLNIKNIVNGYKIIKL